MIATRRVFLLTLSCAAALGAFAQEEPSNEGRVTLQRSAEITVDAEYYRFESIFAFQAKTAEQTMTIANELEEKIESAFEGTPFEKVTPVIGDVELTAGVGDARAFRKVTWSISSAPYRGDKDRQTKLGELVDTFMSVARSIGPSESKGPIPEVADEQPYEDEAIAKALRESLLPAATAAGVVNASLISAVEIEVESITWTPATLNTLTCNAEVRVSYAYEAGL